MKNTGSRGMPLRGGPFSKIAAAVITLAVAWLFGLFGHHGENAGAPGTAVRGIPRSEAVAPSLHLAGPGRVGGVRIVDGRSGKTVHEGIVDLKSSLDRIAAGKKHPHVNDGTVWQNRSRSLPERSRGYYREYVVPTDGLSGPGPQRLVIGREGETYYTPDHYETFIRLE